ncbi:PCNA-interacting partner [Ictalurus furcatus]|uniref:PCNA-interacting partner n=1 Tax=Ictalurus furcatus TaxID=66913 RepID=UPI002350B57E|nr:PCNA-interacting partner [Ictalurus furcatus]XP_053506153.1 PCNA-interacting partner [Ictalurus furcatus]
MGIDELNLKARIRVFRRECPRVLDSERTIIHGADSMLMVLQLAAAEVHKQERGEFGVALSDVLEAWKCLLLDKLHLSRDGSPLPENYGLIRKEYDGFLKRTNTVDLIDVYNMYEELKRDEDPEDPLTAAQMFEFLQGSPEDAEETETRRSPRVPATPSNRVRTCSAQVRRAVRRLFCSYLGMLVNTKNDLALAHALNTPDRCLGRTAFTDLKHAARKSATSLFLAATSFIRAIELGGKGYAPPESDPLRKHLKGLSLFVHFMDQLEEILGETPNPSAAGGRMVSSIRAVLLKGLSSADPVYTTVEDTVKELKERIQQIHILQKESACGTGISPARPRTYAINHATAYAGRETVKVLITVLDEEALAPPCRNKAQLLTDDQTVLNEAEPTCLLLLYKSPELPTGLSPKPLRDRVQIQQEHAKSKVRERGIRSQFACTYVDDGLPLNRVLDFPSTSQLPTCAHPAPKRTVPAAVDAPPEDETDPADEREKQVEVEHQACRSSGTKRAFEQRGTNGPIRTGVSRKGVAELQTITKTSKRKLSNRECVEQGGDENQPPQKRPPAKACSSGPGKKSGNTARKKLIVGQGKLTSFFRL